MLSMKQLVGVRVYKTKPASRREQKKGVDESTKRVGKVHNLVFSPDGKRVVGLMVKRPDIAGMVKGFMVESYLEDGNQPVDGGVYGKSITDACLGWDKTEALIRQIAERV